MGKVEECLRILVRHLGPSHIQDDHYQKSSPLADGRHGPETKTRVEDLEQVVAAFSEYELWLWKGETDAARGQIAPDVDGQSPIK